MIRTCTLLLFLALAACAPPAGPDSQLLEQLMKTRPTQFGHILDNRTGLEVQVIYTQIDRDQHNEPSFRSFYFNADSTRYFYPASTVKLPLALLALEKINRLQLPGLTEHSAMFHDSVFSGQRPATRDTTSPTGLPSTDHYIKKILVVSDNDASNRLYEFVGQAEVNHALNRRGYTARILHRLERPLSPAENRHTEAVRFQDGRGLTVYEQAMLVNPDSIRPPARCEKGTGYLRQGQLVRQPFDFTYKNFYPLEVQQRLLRALIFPQAVPATQRFALTHDQRRAVLRYMSQLPRETSHPPYFRDTTLFDAYCKFLLFGEDRTPIPAHIRIFNKVGDAYGYLIDNAYVVDFENRVEFFLSAVIYCNADGILNDGTYDYTTVGFPFLRDLGQLVYQYELRRPRPHLPRLDSLRFSYGRP